MAYVPKRAPPRSSDQAGTPAAYLRGCPARAASEGNGPSRPRTHGGQSHGSLRWYADIAVGPDRREPDEQHPQGRIQSCCCRGICRRHLSSTQRRVGFRWDRSSCASSTSSSLGSYRPRGVRQRCSREVPAGCCRADSYRCCCPRHARLAAAQGQPCRSGPAHNC